MVWEICISFLMCFKRSEMRYESGRKGESHNKTCRRHSGYYDVTSDDIKKEQAAFTQGDIVIIRKSVLKWRDVLLECHR